MLQAGCAALSRPTPWCGISCQLSAISSFCRVRSTHHQLTEGIRLTSLLSAAIKKGGIEINLPTLPTDNLYKFLALSGLAIAILSLVLPVIRISEIRIKLVEVKTQSNLLNIKIEELSKDTDRLAKKTALSPEETESLRNRLIEHKIKVVELSGRFEQINSLNRDLDYLMILFWGGLPLGAGISVLGFMAWYFLVQKPNDLLLKKQVENQNQTKLSADNMIIEHVEKNDD
jgi:hypothetical protein